VDALEDDRLIETDGEGLIGIERKGVRRGRRRFNERSHAVRGAEARRLRSIDEVDQEGVPEVRVGTEGLPVWVAELADIIGERG
jgi:hypothetical protein